MSGGHLKGTALQNGKLISKAENADHMGPAVCLKRAKIRKGGRKEFVKALAACWRKR
jgi:hypothetical protein